MSFRRHSLRDDLRRRSRIDESEVDDSTDSGESGSAARTATSSLAGAASSPAAVRRTAPAAQSGRNYSEAACLDRQSSLADFVPTRLGVVLLLMLGCCAAVGGLELLRSFAPPTAAEIAPQAEGFLAAGLSVWLLTMTLTAIAVGCLFIYSLRRHKIDDYRGRYRVWIWAALAAVLMSADHTADLGRYVVTMIARKAAVTDHQALTWWLGGCALLGGAFAIRLLVELKACRSAQAALMAAVACWAWITADRLGWTAGWRAEQLAMIDRVVPLVGHFALMFALVLFARHVVLDIQGLVPQRTKAPRPKKQRKKLARSEESAASVRIDAPHSSDAANSRRSDLDASNRTAQPMASSARPAVDHTQQSHFSAAASRSADRSTGDEDDSSSHRPKLSKADRKALRRQMRQEREDEYD